jgi:hypothetical protein
MSGERRFLSCGILRWTSIDFSEEHVATIFRVEEYAKQKTGVNHVANTALKLEVA